MDENLRLFISNTSALAAILDCNMCYLAVSKRWLSDYKLQEQSILGRFHYEIFPEIPNCWKDIHRRVLSGEILKCDEDPFVRLDGSVDWVRWETHPWYTSSGDIGGIYFVAENITVHKNLSEAFTTKEQEFHLLAESMPQIVWITQPDGWSLFLNHQWNEYTGMTLEESLGHGWLAALHPDDQKRAWNSWQNAVNTKTNYSLECQLRSKEGDYRWWLIRGVPVFDTKGQIYKWFGSCTDIQDIKMKEMELCLSEQRMEYAMLHSHTGWWELDFASNRVVRNLIHTQIFGDNSLSSPWSYEVFLERVLPEEEKRVNSIVKAAIAANNGWSFDCRIAEQMGRFVGYGLAVKHNTTMITKW